MKNKLSDRTYWTIVVAVIFAICLGIYFHQQKEARQYQLRSDLADAFLGE